MQRTTVPALVGRDGKRQRTQCIREGGSLRLGLSTQMETLCRLVHFKETLFSPPWFAGFLLGWPSCPLSCSVSSVPDPKGTPPSSPFGRWGQTRGGRCMQGGGRERGSAKDGKMRL